jgi:hypothetical protein
MLESSGYMFLINENFNSPALIVKNTAIIPGSSMRFRSSTISIDVWRVGSTTLEPAELIGRLVFIREKSLETTIHRQFM